jgi:tripartite-type tricarboxylate transporter receptor subunit TctC
LTLIVRATTIAGMRAAPHLSHVVSLVAAVVFVVAHGVARAADVDATSAWPSKPIRLVASLAPGTSLDTLARITATRLSATLGQNVIVENRAGVSGNLASEAVARSAADGYTLLFASNSITTLPAFLGPRAVDPLVALTPVAVVATQPMILVAHPSFAGSDFGDVVRAAKHKPGALAYATSGVGSLAHLTAVWAQARAGITMLHVPYAGSQSFKDVLAGEVPFSFTFVGTALPLVKNGQLKAIAVTSRERSSVMPDVPSLHESGLPDFESLNWIGMFAPAGTPPAIVARLRTELAQMASDPDLVARLRAMGFTPVSGVAVAFGDDIRRETKRWAEIVKAADLRIE